MASLEDILISAQSPNEDIRTNAINLLDQQTHTDPSHFLLSLANHLANPSFQLISRQLAGYYIKNTIKNARNNPQLVNIWAYLIPELKIEIKSIILGVLASEARELRRIAASVISSISRFDLPLGQWPELLPILITNATNANPIYREAALMSLGYIIEEIPETSLSKEEANNILTVIAAGLSSEEKNLTITKTSLSALKNSLKFIKRNIQNDVERKIILDVLYRLCAHPSCEIRKESLSIICDIAYYYYDYIESDLIALGTLTYSMINNDEISVSIIGIEFWNIIGDIELERIEANKPYKGYVATAAASLISILLQKVHIFDENIDENEWNLHKACGTALGNISIIIKDPVIDLVYSYIQKNLTSENWKLQRSATLAFGSILEGPSSNSLSHLIKSSISTLLAQSKAENIYLRQTTAWCLSRVIGFYPEISQTIIFKEVLETFKVSLCDAPSIASHICAALHYLTSNNNFWKIKSHDIESIYNTLLGIGLNQAENIDQSFKITIFATLGSIREKIPQECMPMIENKISLFIDILQQSSRNMQVIICSLLHTIFAKANPGTITEEIADRFMSIVLNMFSSNKTIIEEALEAVGLLSENFNTHFEKYLTSLIPILIWGINETSSSSICKVSAMCVGDLARSLGLKFTPYIAHFVPKFLHILSSENIDLSIKIECIGSLGDMCGIPGAYTKYMENCLRLIDSAAEMSAKPVNEEEDPDLFDGINSLREILLSFYINLVNGLNEAGNIHILIVHVEKLIHFCLVITQDYLKSTPGVHLNAIGLLGDIATCFKESAKYAIKTPPVLEYLKKFSYSDNINLRNMAHHSYSQILGLS